MLFSSPPRICLDPRIRPILIKTSENKKPSEIIHFRGFVPWVGIEPTLPKKLDFESSASTNSATKARSEGTKLEKYSNYQLKNIFKIS